MTERWYKEAVIYCLDVDTFQDSDGDGIGDLVGLMSRLDYLARLGVTCIWLNPIHPSPRRDDGYDVADFYGVHPRIGTLGDFAELVHQAANRGIRLMIDLVVNHTSNEHPWFRSARSSRESRYRDWYVWSDQEPADRYQGMVFPGEQRDTWTFDEEAGAWYYHRFYDFEPDLNMANPAVVREVRRIIAFWLQMGVSGFRVDAAPFIIELTAPDVAQPPQDFQILTDLRQLAQWRRGDAVFLAEANVDPSVVRDYFGDSDASANRLHMLFDFRLNARIILALARRDTRPIVDAIRTAPEIPQPAQWATFLRNHDEVDLSKLEPDERADVFAAFGPDEDMQLYGRGIRRRLAPMLGNDRSRLELAYSLQFTLPGTPVMRYGDEIGMGDALELPERTALRTPMQWTSGRNAGFSTAPAERLVRPVIAGGDFGYERVNVTSQRRDHHSLLSWFERMIRTLRECPEVGTGRCSLPDVDVPRHVLVHRFDAPEGAMLFLHNLDAEPCTLHLGAQPGAADEVVEVFADRGYDAPPADLDGVELGPWGYRWIRLRRDVEAG